MNTKAHCENSLRRSLRVQEVQRSFDSAERFASELFGCAQDDNGMRWSNSGDSNMRLTREIKKDVKADIKTAKKIWLPWWSVLSLMIVSLPIFWLFDHFGRFDLARPSVFSVVPIAFAAGIKRNLRRHVWFWIVIIVIVALHVASILSVPWTTKWVPATVSAGIISVDFFVILVILDTLETLAKKRETRRDSLSGT